MYSTEADGADARFESHMETTGPTPQTDVLWVFFIGRLWYLSSDFESYNREQLLVFSLLVMRMIFLMIILVIRLF